MVKITVDVMKIINDVTPNARALIRNGANSSIESPWPRGIWHAAARL
jgi:hypothetical protein